MSRLATAVGALCLIGWTLMTSAAGLPATVQLVANTPAAADAAPPAQTFTITQPGSYTVTLTDLQLPVALASVTLAIVTPTSPAVILTAAGNQTVNLAAGTYIAQVLATAASGAVGGTFSVQVVPAGGSTPVWQYSSTVGPATASAVSGQSGVSAQFVVSSAGTYQLAATDLVFPAALNALSIGVFVHCGTTPGCTPTAVYTTPAGSVPPVSASLTLAAGTYDLFIVAKANTASLQGLYDIQISGAGGLLYGATEPVGTLQAGAAVAISAAGSVTMKLVDLATPAALTSLQAVITKNGTVLDQVSAAGTTSFNATVGTAELYVAGTPAGGGQGAYEVYLSSGGQAVADIAEPVLAQGSYGYTFTPTLASAGVYQVSVNDFQKPVPLTSLLAVTTQQGVLLGSTQAGASFNAAAGPLNVLVFPTVASSTSEGLFGVTISGPGSSATAFQTTQGVGALFSSQTVTITSAGAYDLTLTDFAFPASFSNLALIATSGNTVTGSIFSAGQLSLNLTAGTYVLSILAQVGPSANYGLYGLALAAAPPAPTVTLTSSASSVTNGESATLTWSSTNATSCSASGGWNGALATSGSQSTGALSENSTFTLTCTGGGGTASASVQVNVTAAPATGSKKGGGALSPEALLALSGLALWVARRRLREAAPPR